MGCTASKLDNEDTVRRCKERRRLMKDAVFSRHHLAAAHADYCRSLRVTGSALYDFAQGEPLLVVSPSTPSVLLHHPKSSSSFSLSSSLKPPPPPIRVVPPSPSPSSIYPPPPPPPPEFSPTIASSKPPKLPHILSDSSVSSTPRTVKSAGKFNFPTATYVANSTYASTPSQASSVWNWENFYPPSPPSSDFFTRPPKNDAVEGDEERESEREEVHCSEWGDHCTTTSSDSDDGDVDDGRETRSEISEIRPPRSHHGSVRSEPPVGRPGPPLSSVKSHMRKVDEKSEDGASSSSMSWKNGGGGGEEVCGSGNGDMRIVVRHKDLKEIVGSIREYFDNAASAGDQVSEMLETGRAQLDRSFRQLKKTVYHSSGVFSNLSSSWTSKPPLAVKYRLDTTVLNESGVSKSLCSTLERLLAWEKKLYEEVKAREGVKIEHEKKLATLQNQEYKGEDEIKLDKTKASIKKLQSLIIVTSQAVNTTSSAIDGLRDSDLIPQLVELCHGYNMCEFIKLWTSNILLIMLLYLSLRGSSLNVFSLAEVNMEKLVEVMCFWLTLLQAWVAFVATFWMMYMWKSMNQFHEVQNQVVQQVRGLVNQPVKGDSTSELHRQATRDLESAVSAWHSSFCRLIKYQRDFILSLHGWFKLTLLPVDKEVANMMRESTDAFSFVDEWKLALDRLPDTVASEAIKSFVNVVHVIFVKQTEEFKIKKRTETISRELEKKASSLRNIEKKYYHSYSMVGLGFPDTGPDNGQVLDARDPLAEKKSELAACQRRVEDEMLKHTKAVEVTRAMSLNNLQTGLPGVFQALTSFSSLFMEALEAACSRSYSIK